MIAKLIPMSSKVMPSGIASAFQRYAPRSSSRQFVLNSISQIFVRALSQRSDSSAGALANDVKLVSTYILKNDNEVVDLQNNLVCFDEYKEKYLMSFEQYQDEYVEFVKTDEKGSSLSKLQKAYNCYVITSYRTYTERFSPSPNPLIF